MTRKILVFGGILAGLMFIGAILHYAFLYVRSSSSILDYLILGYGLNFLMALVIFWVMVYLASKKDRYLGFYFLFGSALKFAIYFLIFEPLFLKDGSVQQFEFFTFFAPYMIALVVETLQVMELLRSANN